MEPILQADNSQLRSKFYALQTPQDIAELLEIDYGRLVYHLYVVPRDKKYTTFTIKKRSGGEREISAPATALKLIQRKLADVLTQVYQPKASTHGFVVDKSIVTNARMHCRKRYVLNLDLLSFFPSISFKRVRGLFQAIPYDRNDDVATWLAHICCWNGSLPQGAPTSPIVSNMICASMDSQLRRLAVKHKCIYTRYADDITFSTSLRQFPSSIASVVDSNDGRAIVLGEELVSLIHKNGFAVNPSKTRLQTANRRQEVTGLKVNRFPNVDRRYISQIRAMLHDWKSRGYENAENRYYSTWNVDNSGPFKSAHNSYAKVVKGKIEFLGMVRGKNDSYYLRFLEQLAELAPNMVSLSSEALRSRRIGRDKLLDALRKRFSKADLNDLCFGLGIDIENIKGNTKDEIALELFKHMDNLNRYEDLFGAVERARPGLFQKGSLTENI